jgi:hypothetical protein
MVDPTGKRSEVSTRELSCPHCGAALPSGADKCWLCFTRVVATGDLAVSDQVVARSKQDMPIVQTGGFSLASLMMFITLVCVVLGVFTIAPGLGVPLAIVAFITWLRTVSVVKWRESTGSALTSSEIIFIFVRSVAFTFLILMLVGVSAVAAFAAFCFGVMSASEPSDSELTGLLVVSVIVLIAAIFGLVAASRSERRRWRRDHHGPK